MTNKNGCRKATKERAEALAPGAIMGGKPWPDGERWVPKEQGTDYVCTVHTSQLVDSSGRGGRVGSGLAEEGAEQVGSGLRNICALGPIWRTVEGGRRLRCRWDLSQHPSSATSDVKASRRTLI